MLINTDVQTISVCKVLTLPKLLKPLFSKSLGRISNEFAVVQRLQTHLNPGLLWLNVSDSLFYADNQVLGKVSNEFAVVQYFRTCLNTSQCKAFQLELFLHSCVLT